MIRTHLDLYNFIEASLTVFLESMHWVNYQKNLISKCYQDYQKTTQRRGPD